AHSWRLDKFAGDVNLEENDSFKLKTPLPSATLGGRNKSTENFDARFVMTYQAPLAPLSCVVELKSYENKPKLSEATDLTVFFIGGSGTVSKLTPTAYFPASTLLPDLPATHRSRAISTSTRLVTNFKSYPNSVMNGCTYKSIPKLGEGT